MVALVRAESGEALLREHPGEEVNAFDPLINGVVPAVETEFVVEDALGQDGCGCGTGFGVAILSVEHEIAEHFRAAGDDAFLGGVVESLGGV